MKSKAEQIENQISLLVNQLVTMAGSEGAKTKKGNTPFDHKTASRPKGATGGLRMMAGEGFFDQPRDLSEVIAHLKTEGRHYPKPTISMALLNLARERVLVRLPGVGSRNNKYAIRK